MKIETWLYWGGRLLLGAIFIYAAIVKMNSPQEFAETIAAYQILPRSTIDIVAFGLPLFELGCGLLVLSGFHLRVGSLGILAMLFAFCGALVLAQLRGLSLDCGCFGSHSLFNASPWIAFIRDLVLLALAAFIYRSGSDGAVPLKIKSNQPFQGVRCFPVEFPACHGKLS